jgi:hypothetical protein
MTETFQTSKMATMTETATTVELQSSLSAADISERLLNGTLHAGYPAIERFMTIDGLLKSHAAEPDRSKKPLICYPVRGAADFEQHTAVDLDRHTDVVVQYYIENGLQPAVSKRNGAGVST